MCFFLLCERYVIQLTVYDILEMKRMGKCRLLAGEENLGHPVRWIHLIYEKDIRKWINRDMIVATDGLEFTNPEEDLSEILYELSDADAAGLIVLIGLHVNVISPRVTELARKLGVPFFTIIDGMDARKLMTDIAQACVRSQKDDMHSDVLKKLMYFPLSDNEKDRYSRLIFCDEDSYVPICFEVDADDNEDNGKDTHWASDRMLSFIRNKFDIVPAHFLYYREKEYCAAMLPSSGKNSDEIVSLIDAARKEIFRATGETFCIGIGSDVDCIDKVRTGISQARAAVDSLHMCHRSDDIRLYEDMGVYRIFFSMSDDRQLRKISDNILGNLPDTEENRMLLDTLGSYISNGCNLARTAENLYIHRNTLKYRLNKVRELIDEDPCDVNENFRLHLAFKIRKYLALKEMKG